MNRKNIFTKQRVSEEQTNSEDVPAANAAPSSWRSRLVRFTGSWLGFSALYAATGSACPFCGQSTCPAGVLGAGIVGGVLAAGFQAWRRFQK